MIIYFLAFVILWSTPACSDHVDEMSSLSIAVQHSNVQIDHVHSLVSDISNLYLNDRFFDVVLVVGEERFRAHRVVLASRNNYFRAILYGHFNESHQPEVKISETPLISFKILLEYIYTGRMDLSFLKDEVIMELLRISDLYGFLNLHLSLSEHLRSNIHVHSVCSLFNLARFHQYKELLDESLNFIENHALDVLHSDGFLSLSTDALQEILIRDSFYANELVIFRAVCLWIKNNQYDLDPDTKMKVLSTVRYPLMSDEELSEVRETQLVNLDTISDAIQFRDTWPPDKLQFRGQLKPNVNLTSSFPCFLAFNEIDGGSMIKLNRPSIINYIRMLFFDDVSEDYSYYVEVSMDGHSWVRVIDHSDYICRSYQHLWIYPRVVWYIRMFGTKNNCIYFEIMYNAKEMHNVEIENGLVAPKFDVALWSTNATTIEGNNHTNRYSRFDPRYRSHQLGSGSILVQLPQPYMLSSMRMQLWDGDDRVYSYTIEASVNNQDWEIIVDKSKESTRSWQLLQFKPRPIVFIRITGVYNSAGNDFRYVHLEAPALVTLTNNETDITMADADA